MNMLKNILLIIIKYYKLYLIMNMLKNILLNIVKLCSFSCDYVEKHFIKY